ncbi:filament-like plant protein [Dorcoceras hygrometricum]|uniref:Filament-like plant protein n=1 Tax=Dorcoceras hygrometricum TaxID=472368 RepID=A0A2Z7CXP2_9LAMI|nr:filament-like plant protein [Dorcoceras hygrometricum]
MEKRKWLWKRKSSDRSPGESDSSGSFSLYSERSSDEQDALRESPSTGAQSPEVTSKLTLVVDDEVKDTVKNLTEKLSAALVNISAKEDLVQQHAKVAEEAVAGWEKAESEVETLKQQLDVVMQQNMSLDVRVSHLDAALKECVRQLRQAKDEQEQRIADALIKKDAEYDIAKAELDKQILDLQAQIEYARAENDASIDTRTLLVCEAMEKENEFLKNELLSRCRQLETMMIERDLSTRAAETASKLQLESIKKIAKLEAECRKLQAAARRLHKSVADSSFYAESATDSQSDGGETLNALVIDVHKRSDVEKNGDGTLAALDDAKINTPSVESEAVSGESISAETLVNPEFETLIKRVEQLEAEKLELERALDESGASLNASKGRLGELEIMEALQKELTAVNDSKILLEFQLIGMEAEARTNSSYVDLLKAENEKEQEETTQLKVKCKDLENELSRTTKESELKQSTITNHDFALKKEDLTAAADKLAECQKTIASLGRQLKSLATLEDFLMDNSNIPGLSSNGMNSPKCDSNPLRISIDTNVHLENGKGEDLPMYSCPLTSSENHATSIKNRNGFGKFFSLSKSVKEIVNNQD